MKLSVIVPVYNVERFLPRCLDSLLRQGMGVGEYEVICVNDGSTDGSAAILTGYEQKHPEIFKVITQENQGVGVTRNVGMKMARGEWIAFVDSDDYIIDNAYKYILDHFCEEEVDVLQFSCVLVYTDGISLYDSDARPDGKISFDGDGAEAYNRMQLAYSWSKLYRRSLLEKHAIQFAGGMLEDQFFNFEVFSHSPHLRIVTSPIYRYEQGNVNSSLTSVDKERIKHQLKDLLLICKKLNRYQQEDGGVVVQAARRDITICLRYYFNKMLRANFTQSEWKEYVRLLNELPIHQMDSSYESTRMGKVIGHLKNRSATSYTAYRCTAWLTNVVFTRFVRHRIIASYSK